MIANNNNNQTELNRSEHLMHVDTDIDLIRFWKFLYAIYTVWLKLRPHWISGNSYIFGRNADIKHSFYEIIHTFNNEKCSQSMLKKKSITSFQTL